MYGFIYGVSRPGRGHRARRAGQTQWEPSPTVFMPGHRRRGAGNTSANAIWVCKSGFIAGRSARSTRQEVQEAGGAVPEPLRGILREQCRLPGPDPEVLSAGRDLRLHGVCGVQHRPAKLNRRDGRHRMPRCCCAYQSRCAWDERNHPPPCRWGTERVCECSIPAGYRRHSPIAACGPRGCSAPGNRATDLSD